MGYDAVECFWVAPTGKAVRTLRRYSSGAGRPRCPYMAGEYSYHDVSIELGDEFDATWTDEDGVRFVAAIPLEDYEDDPRWPTHCECGYEFQPDDERQVNQEPIYAGEGRPMDASPRQAQCSIPSGAPIFVKRTI